MKTRSLRRLLSAALVFACSMSFSVSVKADLMQRQMEIEDEGERIKAANSTLPSAYRSDHEDWAKSIPIKNQYSSGLCWAFATTTAAEYSYAKEYFENTGNVLSTETSPGHFGYFHYNRVNDPLKNTGGDFNGLPEGRDWVSYGGNSIYVMQTLANWSGLALESEAPFSNTMDSTDWTGVWDGETQPYKQGIAYDDELIIENSEYYATLDSNEIKKLILKYGAIASAMYMQDDGRFFNSDRTAYYAYDNGYLNHAITVIGWDDDYPKENFSHQIPGYSPGYSREVTTPRENGAWIIQNSWGNDHNGTGKFYISYYSKESPLFGFFAYDMQPADTYEYNFQYDGSSDCGDSSDYGNEDFYTSSGTRAANVYTNTTNKTLSIDGVGFTTFNEDLINYTIKVYTGLRDSSDPTSGRLASTTAAVTETAGVKNVKLNNSVAIQPGEVFSVVFEFSDDTWFGIEKERYRNGWPFQVALDRNQSFFSPSKTGRWTDIYNYNACFRIKALANTSSLVDAPELSNSQKPSVKSDLTYNGSEQDLITAPTGEAPSGYTMYYAVVKSGESAPKAAAYSKNIPKASEIGSYIVYCLLKGDSMHLDAAPVKLSVNISKAAAPGNIPDSKITCAPGDSIVSMVDLPIGWTWKASDANKAIAAGSSVTATAEYTAADRSNYLASGCTKKITITRPTVAPTQTFVVKIMVDELNVRKGPGINYDIVTALPEGGVYTIVEKQNGWGKLKSGIGWINISDAYVKIIR